MNLALLVGRNPLPNYLVAKSLLSRQSNISRIVLIHSKGTLEEANRLLDSFCKDGSNVEVEKLEVDERSAKDIYEKCVKKFGEGGAWHLDFTGGTKVMGAHSFRALSEIPRSASPKSSYLEASRNVMVFADGSEASLSSDLLGKKPLDLLKNLHLNPHVKHVKSDKKFLRTPWIDRAIRIAKGVKEDDTWLRHLNLFISGEWEWYQQKTLKLQRDILSGVAMTPPLLPRGCEDLLAEWKKECNDQQMAKKWSEFIWKHAWLETFVCTVLKQVFSTEQGWHVFHSVEPRTSQSIWETDVIAVRGNGRILAVSCYSGRGKPQPIRKAAEIVVRANEIGGSLAKPAVFHLGSRSRSIESIFRLGQVTPRVFCVDDFRQLAGSEMNAWKNTSFGRWASDL